MGHSHLTFSKEIRKGTRELDGRGKYDCQRSHSRSVWHRSQASRHGKHFDPAVLEYVRHGLKRYWSPEQICNRMRLDFPEDNRVRISFRPYNAGWSRAQKTDLAIPKKVTVVFASQAPGQKFFETRP